MESDASQMLAAAIQQVDGILAAQAEFPDTESTGDPSNSGGGGVNWALATRRGGGGGGGDGMAVAPWAGLQVVHLTEELRHQLERLGSEEEREGLRRQLPQATVSALLSWLLASTGASCWMRPFQTREDRLSHVETDQESLCLQVSVLTDQVEVQNDKLHELESTVVEQRQRLSSTESLLQEAVSRQLEDLAERITELRCSKAEYESLLHSTKSELAELRERLSPAEERADKPGVARRNGATQGGQGGQIDGHDGAGNGNHLRTHAARQDAPRAGSDAGGDMQQMKALVASLLKANENQERRISELQTMVQAIGLGQDEEVPGSVRRKPGGIERRQLHRLCHSGRGDRSDRGESNHVRDERPEGCEMGPGELPSGGAIGGATIGWTRGARATRGTTAGVDRAAPPRARVASDAEASEEAEASDAEASETDVDDTTARRGDTSSGEIDAAVLGGGVTGGGEETHREENGTNAVRSDARAARTGPSGAAERTNSLRVHGAHGDTGQRAAERPSARTRAGRTGAERRRAEHGGPEEIGAKEIAEREMDTDEMVRVEINADDTDREQIVTEEIVTDQRATRQIDREQICTGDVATDQISREQISTGQVATDQISREQICTGQVATDQISTDQISTDQISTGQVATDQISTDQISTGQVVTDQISTGQGATDQISTDQISTGQVATDQISTEQVATGQTGITKIDVRQTNAGETAEVQANPGDLGTEQVNAAQPSLACEGIPNQPGVAEQSGLVRRGQQVTESDPTAEGEEDERSSHVTAVEVSAVEVTAVEVTAAEVTEGTTEEETEPPAPDVSTPAAGQGSTPNGVAPPYGCSSGSGDGGSGDVGSPGHPSAQIDHGGGTGDAGPDRGSPATPERDLHAAGALPRGPAVTGRGLDDRGPPQAQATEALNDGKFRMSLRRRSSLRRLFKRRSQKTTCNELTANAAAGEAEAETSRPSMDTQELLDRISPSTIHLRGLGSSDKTQEETPTSPCDERRRRDSGFRRLLDKLRKTPSLGSNGDGLTLGVELRPRSFRGPQCRWSWALDPRASHGELETPFASWGVEQVCGWLGELGLGSCVGLARQWVVRGDTLLRAAPEDLERELGLRNPLHRKKLTLALQALGSGEAVGTDALHHTWVTRWLDDIGLPQYKEQFHEARVDGRMLHYITTEDLLLLKVTNLLHHLSIKRGVQVLRLNRFQPDCLIRSAPEVPREPDDVSRWCNEQVVRWLRSVELGEFAPNLRGSGVHGGLMIFEPRFSVETLASLLSIAPSKTLLRRHLSTSFSLLVGREAQQAKLVAADADDFAPLSINATVKARRRRSFRRGREPAAAPDLTAYLCPMELGWGPWQGSPPGSPPPHGTLPGGGSLLRGRSQDELDCIDERALKQW